MVSAKSKNALKNAKMGKNIRPLHWKGKGLAPDGAALDTVKEEMETSMIDTVRD